MVLKVRCLNRIQGGLTDEETEAQKETGPISQCQLENVRTRTRGSCVPATLASDIGNIVKAKATARNRLWDFSLWALEAVRLGSVSLTGFDELSKLQGAPWLRATN